MNELEKRAKHHSKFQKGCLFPFGSAQGCAESLTQSAAGLHGGDGDVGKIVQFKKSSKKYKPGKFEVEEAFVKVYRGYTEYTYTLKCYPHDTEFGTRYHMVDIDDIEAVVDRSNTSLSEARKNLMTKGSKMLSEAVERGIKVYEIEKDGPPEVGRQIIAFVDSHEEYTILTRQDKEYINKQNWGDKEGHKSSDGEYYAGNNGWIYSLGYSKYIYVDELDLVPQRHFDKIAREQQAASERKEQIINKLVSIYGEDLGHKLSALITVKKDNRRVELSAYDSYLIEVAKHSGALKGLYESLINYFDEDTVKKIIMMSPTVKAQYARDKYELPLPDGKTVRWNDYLSAGYLASEANGYLILKRISPKDDLDSLKIQLKNKGILEGSMDIFSFARKYKVENLDSSKLNERWSDDALDELSKKPKDEWTEADWDTYNYCKNANAERDYYDSLDESKKKKVKGVHLNKDAGNVEYNVAAFNHAMSASESPSTNPCGPMGESVGTRWVNFYYNGKKIGGYTAAEEFDGEREDTLSLLAYDNNCDPDDIEVRIENDTSNVVKEDFAKTKDYEYFTVSVPSPSGRGNCRFGVHEHDDGHCSISGIHPYDDGDYHWATSKDGITFNIYVGSPGKLVKKFVSNSNNYEDICSDIAKLDQDVKSVMIHW